MVRQVEKYGQHGVTLFGWTTRAGHRACGRPGAGLTVPGLMIVCGDSHTSTHGALGAYAFGIGASRWLTCCDADDLQRTQTDADHR